MNPDLLRTFLAVRRHRNFTHAAKEMFISQPAVSRRIRQLERELGVAVFDHLGKSLHLTDAGEALATEAERLLASLDRAIEAVREHASQGRGRLRIGAGTTPGLSMLPTLLGEFRRNYPNVKLSYTIDSSAHIVEQVLGNEIDVGFVGRPVNEREILSEPVADDEIVCFARPRHPAVRRKRVDIRSLCDEIWIVRPRGSATRVLFDSLLAGLGCALEHTMELACPEGIRALVAAGIGVSYMSVHALRGDVQCRRLAILPIKGLHLKRSIWQIAHVDKHWSPSMRAFGALIRERLRTAAAQDM